MAVAGFVPTGREKDLTFTRALLEHGLVDADTLIARAELLDEIGAHIRRIVGWVEAWKKHNRQGR